MPLCKIVRDFIAEGVRTRDANADFKDWTFEWSEDTDMRDTDDPQAIMPHDCPRGPYRTLGMIGGGASFCPEPSIGSFQPVLVGACPSCRRVFLSAVFDFGEWERFKKEVGNRRKNEKRQ